MSADERYWFQNPSVLFQVPPDSVRCAREKLENGGAASPPRTVAQKFGDAFLPSTQQTLASPSNVNRITRIVWLVAIILSLVLWSWLPVGIAAGLTLLALLIGTGLSIYEERERRAQASACHQPVAENPKESSSAADGKSAKLSSAPGVRFSQNPAVHLDAGNDASVLLSESRFENLGRAPTPMTNASIFMPPNFPPTIGDENGNSSFLASSYVPNEHNRSYNPVVREREETPRDTTLPNPVRHNSYENVDARYRRYEMQPHRVETEDNFDHLESNVVGEPAGACECATEMMEITSCNNDGACQSSPEAMINSAFCDQGTQQWNENVKNRALDWRSNPNDPRNRQRELEYAQKRQSIRSLSWNQGP